MPSSRQRPRRQATAYFVISGICACVGTALLVAAVVGPKVARAQKQPATSGASSGATLQASRAAIAQATEQWLAQPVALTLGEKTFSRTWHELGAALAPSTLAGVQAANFDALAAAGMVPVALDAQVLRDALVAIKQHVDTLATDARLDLEARRIVPEQPGFELDVEASLVALTLAARSGQTSVALAGRATAAVVTQAGLGIDDISQVLASFKTNFVVSDRDRNFNLKLAASHLHGHVIAPGEVFSFNDVVGDRTEQTGYRVAHVISAGEMIDGLAGGTCQISTTLFGAAFFAGLDVVSTTTHSRPLAYAPMGMDATVTFPNIDLKLRNPYDFPVVIRYRVANGEALVEILGKARPWDKIEFSRDIVEELPFERVSRDEPTLALGDKKLDQPGMSGYRIKRYRKFYKDGKVVKTNRWELLYAPVVEYVKVGTNANKPPPEVAPPAQFEPSKPKNMNNKIVQ